MVKDSEIVVDNLVPEVGNPVPGMLKRLMIKDPKVSGNYLVLEDRPRRNVDPVPVVCNDDHSTSQAHWVGMVKDDDGVK